MNDARAPVAAGNELERYLPHTRIAYLSMEIALEPDIPTYSGGLGILAGDAARSAADLGLPMVFVTLASRDGYLRQELDAQGGQLDTPDHWDPADHATALPAMVAVEIEHRQVWVRPWLYILNRPAGRSVPVLLLDTDCRENDPADRGISGRLYGGDVAMRLRQEIVLGIGGEMVLSALGFEIATFHLNEGHAALLPLALLRRHPLRTGHVEDAVPYDVDRVVERCVFTTHTPIAAGHDRFGYDLVVRLLGDFFDLSALRRLAGDDALNMTRLAISLSGSVNGVAKRHQQTAAAMFPGHLIRSITNGVHPETWVQPALARLYATLDPQWTTEPEILVRADTLPAQAVLAAHAEAKGALLDAVYRATGRTLSPDLPTIVFARRMTGYKRADLLLADPERLARIARDAPFQVLYAGKAHPQDGEGRSLIGRIQEASRRLSHDLPIVFVPGYDFALAKLLVAGADVWLNTPLPPLEASGTSGMKAALNGVPSLSVLDGWWLEACIEGVTGWAIGDPAAPDTHAGILLDKLEHTVLPLFRDREAWARLMMGAISKSGAVFTSHRMMRRYAAEAYLGSMLTG
ncbi:alpha-glucan family phosphorylase [Lichenicoccus roseus]|uniref:glycogen phosphorylase n=1 Tax=Lichenicoccus roseus TaxID=2683649 RepID=A0A5R9J2V7_9PROT|nr:alpha-glucan family phosphorylase [Lichenicoccus roseus]TLU70827.1 alpha-glucan family phosphorylase [Lichenicoccus roseus]